MQISIKSQMAKWVAYRPIKWMLGRAIRLFAPKHRVGIGVVLLNDAQQVLLLKHVFHPDYPWGLPGGWLDRDEDPEEGAKRELFEETGLTATIQETLFIVRQRYPSHLGIAYLAQPDEVAAKLALSNEILEAKWFDMTTLPRLLPFTKRAIQTAVHRQTIRVQEHA